MTTNKDLKKLWAKIELKRRAYEYERDLANRWSKVALGVGGGLVLLICIEMVVLG